MSEVDPEAGGHDNGTADNWLEEVRFAASERLSFFTDAVAAIAITLLALELPVPDGDTSAEVWHALAEQTEEYLAFVISFLVISAHWRFHHGLFRYVRHASQHVVTLNFGWLFLLVITPFTTKLISLGEGNLLRFGIYASTEALQFGLFAVMAAVIIRQRLARPEIPVLRLRQTIHRVVPFAIAFAIAIPLYPWLGNRAYWIWAVVPLLGRLFTRVSSRRSAQSDPDD